jgi:hypothetical protein
MLSTCYSCQILIKLEFSQRTFKKSSNIKFNENLPSGSRLAQYGLADRHDEANSRF